MNTTNFEKLIEITNACESSYRNKNQGIKKAAYVQAQLLSEITVRVNELAGSQLYVDLSNDKLLLYFLKNRQSWAEATIYYDWRDDEPMVTDIELFFANDEMAYAYYIVKDKLQRWLMEKCAKSLTKENKQ